MLKYYDKIEIKSYNPGVHNENVKKNLIKIAGALTPMVANWLIDPNTGLDPITGWRIFFATGIIETDLVAYSTSRVLTL